MNNKTKTSKAAGGVVALAAGIVGTTVLVSQLAAETPDPTTAERQQPAAAHHYTGPTTPDAAQHWFDARHDWEDRVVHDYTNRIVSGQLSMQDFESIADRRVDNGAWTQKMVDRIVKSAQIKSVAQLYQGIARRTGPLGVNEIEPDPDLNEPRHQPPPHDSRSWTPDGEGPPANWRRLMDEVDTMPASPEAGGTGYQVDRAPADSRASPTADGSLDYAQIALGGLAGATILAAVAGTLGRRRRRQPQLEEALASGEPDDLSRAAGLLGDLFVQQSRAGAAEHAYRAAIDTGDQYWSPIAQVALAHLLSDRGERTESQALLEAALASGHPRAVPAAQASLDELLTGKSHKQAIGPLHAYETLGDGTSAHR